MEDSQQELPTDQPQKPTSSRKWLRILIGVVFVLALLVVGGWFALFGRKKFSEPYRMALSKVKQDFQVIERLGEPIRDTEWFPTGGTTSVGDRLEARYNFTISGPKGSAAVSTVARCIEDKWGLTTLDVRFPDGRYSVRVGSGEALQAAPKFSPQAPPDSPEEKPTESGPADPIGPAPDLDIDIPGIPGD
jgi:hypothetical protein